jgi:hypothetical protein
LHFAAGARAAAARSKIDFFGACEGGDGRPPTESPDCNSVEKLFAQSRTYLIDREVKKPAGTLAESNRRFEQFCDAITPDKVRAIVNRLPKTLADIIAAKGGPVKG